jgi:hypothetical protein
VGRLALSRRVGLAPAVFSSAMAARIFFAVSQLDDTKLSEIVGAEFGQHLGTDRVFLEGTRILPDTQSIQPVGHSHE